MSIHVCGDTHIPHDYFKLYNRYWPQQRELTKKDFLIVLGDFGLCWLNVPDNEEKYITKELQVRKFTTLFVDGNHENFARIEQFPEIDMFGGKVGVYADGIYHLKRGYVYTIDDKKIFVFGGARSIDKAHRTTYIDWWPGEQPTKAEEDFAMSQLDKVNWRVDYILTHTAPQSIVDQCGWKGIVDVKPDPCCEFLEMIKKNVLFKEWHFGHFHDDKIIEDKFYLHYNEPPFPLR